MLVTGTQHSRQNLWRVPDAQRYRLRALHTQFCRFLVCSCFVLIAIMTAYELGWSNALLFCGTRPQCVASDHIEFRKPVPIGTVTIFSSIVSYVEANMMQVRTQRPHFVVFETSYFCLSLLKRNL